MSGSNSFSRSFSISEGQSGGLTLSSGEGSNSASTFFTASGSTVSGTSGTTSFYSSSSTFTGSASSSVVYKDLSAPDFTEGGQTTFSGSNATTISSTQSAPTAYVQTSTTLATTLNQLTTSTYEDEGSTWTTDYDEEESVVRFFTTETTSASTQVVISGEVVITQEGTTLLDQTQTFGERATVIQANTIRAQNAEIIYVLDPPTAWAGYSVASDAASSGTRFTIHPSFSTEQSPVADGSISQTKTTSNEEVSSTISWSATTTTQGTQIRGIGTAIGLFNTAAAIVSMPISTTESVSPQRTTTGSTLSFTAFFSNVLTFDAVNANRNDVTTTSQITSWASSVFGAGASRTKFPRRSGDLQYETTAEQAASTTRITTTVVAASFSAQSSGQNSSGGNGTTTFFESGVTADFNFNVFGPAQASTQPPGAGFGREKFITSGAVLGSNRGGYYTAEGSFFLPIALDGGGRRGATIFPSSFANFPFVTAFSDSVTYTTSVGTDRTTSSAVIGLEGESFTTTQNRDQSFAGNVFRPIIQGAAAPLPNGMTVVDFCRVAGAFKNISGGGTSSFSEGMTSYSEGESAPLSVWRPVTGISPPVLRMSRSPLFWTVARNPDLPPPDSPDF
jgi:hypothetical protein